MRQAILAGMVLSGAELKPIVPGALVVDRGRIAAVGAPDELELPAETTSLPGATILPGFIDAHVHIGLADPADVLEGGVTAARDLGWPPDAIWPAVASSRSEEWRGPRLIAAGQMLTVPDGYPMRASWAPRGTGRPVKGPDDAAAAVAEQADRGATIIKVALNAAVGPTLSFDQLAAIVAAARARGLSVTAHITGLAELEKAVNAGVDELAHMLMSEETIPARLIERMVAAHVVVVPTLACRFDFDREQAIDNLKRWLAAGGRVIYGTDLGNEGPTPGIDEREITGLTAAGMEGRDIIAAATVDSARYLGLDDTGVIEPGVNADLVAVKGDPLGEATRLLHVVGVWRAGRRVR